MKTPNACKMLALAATLALSTTGFAEDSTGSKMSSSADQQIIQQLTQLSKSVDETTSDKLFVLHTGLANLLEVEMSQLVANKTNDPKIKALAEQLATDHTDANEKLKPIAQELGVQLPTELPSMKKAELAIYEAMPADKLEMCYLADQKAMHAKTVTSFADHANMVKNDKLKSFVTTMLPKLEAHTKHIVKVAQDKGVSDNLTSAKMSSD